MAEITAALVKELREKTDAPMMECKKALTEAEGDLARAEEILRVKLGNKASKAAATNFSLTNAKGDVVRKWAGTAAGFKTSWNGTDSSGDVLKPGFYKLTGTALGKYDNKATVKAVTVRVSAKEFEMRDGEWKLKG